MLPLNHILEDAFEKFELDFLASNLPEGKYIKPPLRQPNTTWSSIQVFPRSVFLLSPLGPLWARFPYMFSRNLNTKLCRISVPSVSQLLSQRLPLVTQLWRTVSTVSRLPQEG